MALKTKHTIPMWKKVMNLLLWLVLLAYFPIVMSFVSAEKAEAECVNVVASIENISDDVMITRKVLESKVKHAWPALAGTKLNELNLYDMEREIEKSAVVKNCQMYTTPSGTLHVSVLQREPIMHVFNSSGSYYMDSDKCKITSQSDVRANTVVVNGNVDDKSINDLIKICLYLKENNFWRSQIEQIYVTAKHEFILIPRVGDHTIEFGEGDRIEEKFDNLLTLYKKGWQPKEWNLYSRVSVKYRGQIICTKR